MEEDLRTSEEPKDKNQYIEILHGLPCSGKSTYAEEVVKNNKNTKRVSRDYYRFMFDNYSLDHSTEKLINESQKRDIIELLKKGFNVIIDNTNLKESYIKDFLQIRDTVNKNIEVKVTSFADVDFSVIKQRNELRKGVSKYIPDEVFDRMKQQLKNMSVSKIQKIIQEWNSNTENVITVKQDPSLPKCIIVDIDGTLAHRTDRSPYDYSRVLEDTVDEAVKMIVNNYYYNAVSLNEISNECTVFIFSAREDVCKKDTEKWLRFNDINYNELHMRKAGDKRKDTVVKKEMFDKFIKNKYYVDFVLDDRNCVVDLWRTMGLKCLQCEYGDF